VPRGTSSSSPLETIRDGETVAGGVLRGDFGAVRDFSVVAIGDDIEMR